MVNLYTRYHSTMITTTFPVVSFEHTGHLIQSIKSSNLPVTVWSHLHQHWYSSCLKFPGICQVKKVNVFEDWYRRILQLLQSRTSRLQDNSLLMKMLGKLLIHQHKIYFTNSSNSETVLAIIILTFDTCCFRIPGKIRVRVTAPATKRIGVKVQHDTRNANLQTVLLHLDGLLGSPIIWKLR